ncbi:glycosyltransferase family 2 protein [Funiculus sociatus GB2-A5]|uniref:Glycosyltransferase family 2 protein n=1 Tax=Funiculus sociatus GB2-A5 TaxID=2933946 RepID=A0ABV0JUH2_9CYAN|nr:MULTISPECIES: glycosyltransferase family 2 protein [unclassified Trichocoleus]MBD1908900.1 glycosyltransferase family 2 protein [Trichocoleus sp. FACHB-832]MBD2064549.1 glycosyltransferase family 2 protein [Trichocoleus sp. FACHB-6]
MKTPVALLIFKRPETTEKVFEAIRQAKPPKLLVVADGPRADKPGEAEQCAAARAIIDRVDWDCEVLKNYSDVNLGCGLRPATGITWVFEQVEEAIIFEDDCLPHPTFFQFCEELLSKYRNDERVMAIAGTSLVGEWRSPLQSYYFSQFGGNWGWASWRRAWKFFDYNIKLFPQLLEAQFLEHYLREPKYYLYWKKLFQEIYEFPDRSCWDYQWLLACWMQNGLRICPEVNLITNIGFGANATHTFSDNPLANVQTQEINLPLKHPQFMIQDFQADHLIQDKFFNVGFMSKLKRKIARTIKIK